jgi:hypothetical protein
MDNKHLGQVAIPDNSPEAIPDSNQGAIPDNSLGAIQDNSQGATQDSNLEVIQVCHKPDHTQYRGTITRRDDRCLSP